MKQLSIILSIIVALFILCCSSGPVDKKIVTVSIEPQRFLLEKVVGDKVQVRCLLTDGANPETYDPSMTHMINLQKSSGYLRMGNIGFEAALLDKIHDSDPDLPIYNTSSGIIPILGTHGHPGHSHEEIDPHTWTSLKNARVIVTNMLNAMVEIDPDNRAYYQKNAKNYIAHLDSLHQALSQKLASKKGESFMVWHPSLSYFARDYGLNQLTMGGQSHKENSIMDFKQSIDSARQLGAKVFFHSSEFDPRQVNAVNSELQAREVVIHPLTYEWEQEIINIANAIAEGDSASVANAK